jgi:cell division septal protein FtsQ
LALKRRKIGMVFLIVLAIVAFLWIMLMQFTARVTMSSSDTSLSKKIDNERYVKAINEYLGGHPTSRLRFALDHDDLKNYLTSVLPEVADVTDVTMGAIGETNITLAMRRPVAGWTINSKQYFVDANGVAFEQNYFSNPTVEIVDNSGVALQQGATASSNRFLGFVGRVVALSKDQGYDVVQAIIPTDTTRQLEIVLKDIVPHVKLSSDRGAGEQVEDMVRALKYLAAHGQNPGYIDIRVSGKAFYK